MSGDSRFSSLCRLFDESLRPYTDMQEPKVISLTKDREKDLLITLSQVSRKIQLMKQELDCDSEEKEDWESDGDKKSSGESDLHHEDCNCSTKILTDLIILLTVESKFLQHLVGNILVLVSKFVAASGSEWDSFIRSLFICLKLAIGNVLSRSFAPSTTGARDQNNDSSTFVVLRSTLRNANWSTAAAIIRVLCSTLKYLKQERDDQLPEAYVDSVSSFLFDVPWDVMEELQVGHGSDTKESYPWNSHSVDTSFFRNITKEGMKFVFLGSFIQLLCSLVEQCLAAEAKVGAQDHHPVLCIIIRFMPTLLRLCLGKRGNYVKLSISQYFRHKLLMLMLRVSYQTCLGYTTLISWLQLLHDYFEELLRKSITEQEFSQDEFLEDSPFLTCLSDGGLEGFTSCHLQRLGVFLFLRCCFGLINLTGDIHNQCACETPNSCSTFDSPMNLSCYARKKGFFELYIWLQEHLSTGMSMDSEMYSEKHLGFALSFLQLYMQEDDILFKVLLQLLGIHFILEQQSNGDKWTFEDVDKDIIFHVSTIFNPVYLFHLFLAELHYDHQVILDYLISNDTGANCAEYLLRCLRMVCNSWHLFLTFSMHEKLINPSSYKKRKLFLDGSNLQADVSSVLLKGIPSSLEEKHKKDVEYSCKRSKTTRLLFKEAKNCLLSLKYSVESLHRKNLFPYNPEVLLRRLTKFQELCFDLNSHDISLTGETT